MPSIRSFLVSASYAGLKDWAKAVEDAKECIRLNPQFMKGFYRLATAQLELDDFTEAQATIKQGLALDANNSQLLKVLRTIKQAKKAANTAAIAPQKNPDSATSRELYDLQVQHSQTTREFNTVQANLAKTQREHRVNQITLGELDENPSVGAYYRSIGKMFVKSTRERVLEHLKSSFDDQQKKESDLKQKMEYLGRRIKTQRQNMEELVATGE
jgi:chaperonin cofactor prefoldin